MSYTLNEKIRDLKPYDPIEGDYRIRLDANESYFNIPEALKTQVKSVIDTMNFNRYPDPLAKKVCREFAAYYGVDPAHVTAYNGSDETLFVLMTAFLMRGDKVITLSNDFSMYGFYAFLAEGQHIVVEKNEDLTIDVDRLIETANREQAAMIVFSNPCNPTSLGLTREDVLKLITSVQSLVILDEAYMDFWDQSLITRAAEFDNLIVLRTCSKAFGMASVRLGFSVANPTLTNAMRAVKSPYNSNVITQEVGALVYASGDLMRQRTAEIIASRAQLQKEMEAIAAEYPGAFRLYQSCTNFVYLKTDLAKAIHTDLLENSIAVRCFGNGYLRITAGTAEENTAVAAAIRNYLSRQEAEK